MYIGSGTAAVEYARSINDLGNGKLISLLDDRVTLSQLSGVSAQELEATLTVTIVNSSTSDGLIECFDDSQRSTNKSLRLAGMLFNHQ